MLVQPMARENTMEATYSLRWLKYSTTDTNMNSDCTKLRTEAKLFRLEEARDKRPWAARVRRVKMYPFGAWI